MRLVRFARREFLWALVTLGTLLLPLAASFLVLALFEDRVRDPARSELRLWVQGGVLFPFLILVPTINAIVIVLLRAVRQRRPFASRHASFRFHALAAYAGALVLFIAIALLDVLSRREAGYSRAPEFFIDLLMLPLQSLAVSIPVFVLLYWPRVVFPSLSGLASDGPATSRTPRS